MSSRTKIIVLHMKELIYTGIFIALGILFIVLLAIMFLPSGKKEKSREDGQTVNAYIPGIYTTSIKLGGSVVDVEIVVDENSINSLRLVNLDEAVATMYPLIEPSFEELSGQITENQSLEGITYSDDSRYTSILLLNAVEASLEKAANHN
ncbi:MAG: hypothetical protein SOY45_03425 [Lachnospiraceae bacterium]|nr:hypothetical protein [Lachnospiraceae bacterium]MDY4068915.1 hypothetical protein [Lachnospiraceae bacterium]